MVRGYTTIEQSRKLAKILPLESADMVYIASANDDIGDILYTAEYKSEIIMNEGDTDIEYTRTDAFIDKATEWLCNNYDKYIRVIGSSIYPAYSDLCRDFQNYMKEEQDDKVQN